MSEIHWYIADLETTGLKIGYAEICEYSIIRATDRVQLSRQIRVDNVKNASYDALKITGKTIEDLYRGISKQQAIDDFHSFIEQDNLTPAYRCLVGHNIYAFDRKFLHHLWEQYGKEFPFDMYLDTVPLCKRLAAQMGQPKAKVNLDAAMDLFGLKKVAAKAHSAKGDSRNTYYLWKHLMDSGVEYIDLIKQHPHRNMTEISNEDFEVE